MQKKKPFLLTGRQKHVVIIICSFFLLLIIGAIAFKNYQKKQLVLNNTVKEKLDQSLSVYNDTITDQMETELESVSDYLSHLDAVVCSYSDQLSQNAHMVNKSSKEEINTISNTLSESFDKSQNQIQTMMTNLQSNLEFIHTNISATQVEIQQAITDLNTDISNWEKDADLQLIKIDSSIESVNLSLDDIHTDMEKAHEELKLLFKQVKSTGNSNYEKLLSILAEMEQKFEQQTAEDMQQIFSSFQKLTEDFSLKTEKLQENISSLGKQMNVQIDDLDQNLSDRFNYLDISIAEQYTGTKGNILQLQNQISSFDSRLTSQITNMDSSVTDQFNALNKALTLQSTETGGNIVNSKAEVLDRLNVLESSLSQDLQLVFQFASDGKKKLASALLAKGVSVNDNATFSQLKDAILSIDQKLVIGVQEIPGTIVYDYHYHQDRNGNNIHTESTSEKGGCYTVPKYHVHSRADGCYKTEYYHSHNKECPGHSIWVDWNPSVPDGYWGWTYECGNQPSNSSREILVCSKSSSTVDAYYPSCGLSDGQIIGAVISYNRDAITSQYDVNVPQEDVQSLEAVSVAEEYPPAIPETNSEETESESALESSAELSSEEEAKLPEAEMIETESQNPAESESKDSDTEGLSETLISNEGE